jgi:hypothetical protein
MHPAVANDNGWILKRELGIVVVLFLSLREFVGNPIEIVLVVVRLHVFRQKDYEREQQQQKKVFALQHFSLPTRPHDDNERMISIDI